MERARDAAFAIMPLTILSHNVLCIKRLLCSTWRNLCFFMKRSFIEAFYLANSFFREKSLVFDAGSLYKLIVFIVSFFIFTLIILCSGASALSLQFSNSKH